MGLPLLLTPGHGGGAGTRALNAAAKARLNPGPGAFGGFDPGDRVAWSPVPGTTLPGRVVDGDSTGLHVELSDGTRLTLSPAQTARLRHGWALTAHQAVGVLLGIAAVAAGAAVVVVAAESALVTAAAAALVFAVLVTFGARLATVEEGKPGQLLAFRRRTPIEEPDADTG